MNILPQQAQSFDTFLSNIALKTRENIVLSLGRLDRELCSALPKSRYRIVRIDRRTILTSYGIIAFRRRYVRDCLYKECLYPLDACLGLRKCQRISSELRLRILDLASVMTYREVGRKLSLEFSLSKSTVCRIVGDTLIDEIIPDKTASAHAKIHIQLDEKYIGSTLSVHKRKYYTMAVFSGSEPYLSGKTVKHRLLSKTILSSSSLPALEKKINALLREKYRVRQDEEVFLSGDLASYIQNFPEKIRCCKATYVPDKYHVIRFIKDFLGLAELDAKEIDQALISLLKKTNTEKNDDIAKIVRLYEKDPHAFEAWGDPEYLGCSQEGMNSHYYAPRFGKYANRFKPSTIEKLALVIESRVNGSQVILSSKSYVEPKMPEDIVPSEVMGRLRYVLDTSGMSYATVKMFNAIKFGNI